MAKRRLKTRIMAAQEMECALTGEGLPADLSLVDTDRILQKMEGGVYDDDNTRVVLPRAHMERHGTLRERDAELEAVKALFDDRVQMMRLRLKIGNQMLAYARRTDTPNPDTVAFLTQAAEPVAARIAALDRQIAKALSASADPLRRAAMGVPGLGPVTVAALSVYVDLSKAATPSALWKYVGMHTASHERYTKGEAGGGNKTLRTVLWNTANVMMKLRTSAYREVYDRTKLRLSESEKVVKSRSTQGHLVEVAWRDAKPSHRHGAALRAVVKHLLADYWLVGRTLAGLPTPHLYAEAQLGHTHIVEPAARGWKF